MIMEEEKVPPLRHVIVCLADGVVMQPRELIPRLEHLYDVPTVWYY